MALPPISSGQVLGDRYRLDAKIGRGGMGEVWRARDETLQTDVAVKLLLVPSSPEVFEEAKARFDVEQRALVKLRSPYVVRIQDRGLTEHGQPYFVMELLSGRSLQDHLDQRTRLEVPEVLELLEDMGRAIQEPHQKGLAHRDIKPGNIFLIEYTGQRRLEVRLLDFGVAKSIGGEAEEGSVTTAGMMVGTPLFIAPEQINGTPALRSDIYSIGIVAYRCLAGRAPYRGEQVAVLRQHLGAPMPPFPLDVAVPPALSDLIRRMLEKEPDDRPSAEEMVEEVLLIRASLYGSVEDSVPPGLAGLGTPVPRVIGLTPHTPRGSHPGVSGGRPVPEAHPVTGTFETGAVQAPVSSSKRWMVAALALLLLLPLVAFGMKAIQPRPVLVESVDPKAEARPVPSDLEALPSELAPGDEAGTVVAGRSKVATTGASDEATPGGEGKADEKPEAPDPQPEGPKAQAEPKEDKAEAKPPVQTGSKGSRSGRRGGRRSAQARPAEPKPEVPDRPPPIEPTGRSVGVTLRAGASGKAVRILIDGRPAGSTPTRVWLKEGTKVQIEYLGTDGVRRRKAVTVPLNGGIVTLD